MEKPKSCLQLKPTSTTPVLSGVAINVSAICRAQGLGQGYVSKILSGERRATIDYYIKIAAALGMSVNGLIEAIDERVQSARSKERAIIDQHYDRLRREDASDFRALKSGHVPPPRLPALRAS